MEMKRFETVLHNLNGKRVLFVATKNVDYLRITQEIELFEKYAESVDCIVSTKKGYFHRIFEVILRLFQEPLRSYDIVFVSFQAQFIIPLFYWKLKKKEIWSDFFISIYDTLVFDRKRIEEKSFIAWIAKKVDRYTLDKSDLVICDTIAHGTYFCEEFGTNSSKMYVLHLKADEVLYFPQKVDKCEEYQDKYVVLYFGSILPLQGIETILRAIRLLKDNQKIFFIMIGPVRGIEKKEYPNVKFYEWLSQEELAKQIACADLCLAGHFNSKIEKAKRTIPGKAYIYEAMKKPMILGENCANRELFEEDDMHFFVEMGNAEALALQIVDLEEANRCPK